MLTAHGSLDFLRLLQFCSHTMTGFLFLLFSLVVDINNDLSQGDVKEVNENFLIQREGHKENGQNAVQFCWENLHFRRRWVQIDVSAVYGLFWTIMMQSLFSTRTKLELLFSSEVGHGTQFAKGHASRCFQPLCSQTQHNVISSCNNNATTFLTDLHHTNRVTKAAECKVIVLPVIGDLKVIPCISKPCQFCISSSRRSPKFRLEYFCYNATWNRWRNSSFNLWKQACNVRQKLLKLGPTISVSSHGNKPSPG